MYDSPYDTDTASIQLWEIQIQSNQRLSQEMLQCVYWGLYTIEKVKEWNMSRYCECWRNTKV